MVHGHGSSLKVLNVISMYEALSQVAARRNGEEFSFFPVFVKTRFASELPWGQAVYAQRTKNAFQKDSKTIT